MLGEIEDKRFPCARKKIQMKGVGLLLLLLLNILFLFSKLVSFNIFMVRVRT